MAYSFEIERNLFGKSLLLQEETVSLMPTITLNFHRITLYVLNVLRESERPGSSIGLAGIIQDVTLPLCEMFQYIDLVLNEHMNMRFANIFNILNQTFKDIPIKTLIETQYMNGLNCFINIVKNMEKFLNVFSENIEATKDAIANFLNTLRYIKLIVFKLNINSSQQEDLEYTELLQMSHEPLTDFRLSDDERSGKSNKYVREIPSYILDHLVEESRSREVHENQTNRFSLLNDSISCVSTTHPNESESSKLITVLQRFREQYGQLRLEETQMLSPKEVSHILNFTRDSLLSLKSIPVQELDNSYLTECNRVITPILKTISIMELLQSVDFEAMVDLYRVSTDFINQFENHQYQSFGYDIHYQIKFFLSVSERVEKNWTYFKMLEGEENISYYTCNEIYTDSNRVMYAGYNVDEQDYPELARFLPLVDRLWQSNYIVEEAYIQGDESMVDDEESAAYDGIPTVEYGLGSFEDDEALFQQENQRGEEPYGLILKIEDISSESGPAWEELLNRYESGSSAWEKIGEDSCLVCCEKYSLNNPCVIAICKHFCCISCWKKMYDDSCLKNTKMFCPCCRGHFGEVIMSSDITKLKNSITFR